MLYVVSSRRVAPLVVTGLLILFVGLATWGVAPSSAQADRAPAAPSRGSAHPVPSDSTALHDLFEREWAWRVEGWNVEGWNVEGWNVEGWNVEGWNVEGWLRSEPMHSESNHRGSRTSLQRQF